MFRTIFNILVVIIISIYFSPIVLADGGKDYTKLDNFKDFITDYTVLENGVSVMEIQDGILWARALGTDLLKSEDRGHSWVFVYSFEKPINAIFCDDQGNIFVSLSLYRGDPVGSGELHKSADGGMSFVKVLDIEAGVPLNWNFAARDGKMFVSEYGYKGKGNNARRIYRSVDHGDSWDIVYTPQETFNYHCHKIVIDQNGIVYQSIGDDGNAKIMKSTDSGANWETVILRYHPTSAVETNSHIVWGLDSGPVSGISRLNKKTGKMDLTFALPKPYMGSCYDMKEANGVIYAVFMSYEGNNHPASIWYSKNQGQDWKPLGRIEKQTSQGIGLYLLNLDDEYGYIDFQSPLYTGGDFENYAGTLRFKLLKTE